MKRVIKGEKGESGGLKSYINEPFDTTIGYPYDSYKMPTQIVVAGEGMIRFQNVYGDDKYDFNVDAYTGVRIFDIFDDGIGYQLRMNGNVGEHLGQDVAVVIRSSSTTLRVYIY